MLLIPSYRRQIILNSSSSRYIALVVSVLFLHQNVLSQDSVSHAYLRGGVSGVISWRSDFAIFYMGAFSLCPGVRLAGTRGFDVVATAPVSAGASFTINNRKTVGADLPIMMELHFGAAAAQPQNTPAGFIIGAGIAYTVSANFDTGGSGEIDFGENSGSVHFFNYRLITGLAFKRNKDGDGLLLNFVLGRGISQRRFVAGVGLSLVMGN